MDILGRIDDGLNPKDEIKRTDYSLFESKITKSLGMITESLDSFLNIIESPRNKQVGAIMNYLQTVGPIELEEWVNALEIAVVDREVLNRWTLGLAQETLKLDLPQHLKPVLSGVLEALSAAPWSEPSQL